MVLNGLCGLAYLLSVLTFKDAEWCISIPANWSLYILQTEGLANEMNEVNN